MNVTIASDWG